jgi:peroxiredoxin
MKLAQVLLYFVFVAAASTVLGFAAHPSTCAKLSSAKLCSTAVDTNMAEIKVGDCLPSVELKELTESGGSPVSVNLSELCAGKKVAIFGVPGAFTPGCSKSHLPSFIDAQADLKAKGIDATFCVATNDAYVMQAWGKTSGGAAAGIRFLADDSGALTRALGLVKETPVGIRTARFSLVAENNTVKHYFNAAKETSDTWAPNILAAL